jgi:hypothetical protein
MLYRSLAIKLPHQILSDALPLEEPDSRRKSKNGYMVLHADHLQYVNDASVVAEPTYPITRIVGRTAAGAAIHQQLEALRMFFFTKTAPVMLWRDHHFANRKDVAPAFEAIRQALEVEVGIGRVSSHELIAHCAVLDEIEQHVQDDLSSGRESEHLRFERHWPAPGTPRRISGYLEGPQTSAPIATARVDPVIFVQYCFGADHADEEATITIQPDGRMRMRFGLGGFHAFRPKVIAEPIVPTTYEIPFRDIIKHFRTDPGGNGSGVLSFYENGMTLHKDETPFSYFDRY